MKKLVHYALPLGLLFLLLVGEMFFYRSINRELSVNDVEVVSYTSSAQRSSSSELKADESDAPRIAPLIVHPESQSKKNATMPPSPILEATMLSIPNQEDAMIPAAFGMTDNDSNLDDDQKAKIYEIIKSFAHEVESSQANPDDPAYLARWQKAQADADDRLRLVLGQEDYLKYTLATAHLDTNR